MLQINGLSGQQHHQSESGNPTPGEFVMTRTLIAAVLIAASATVAAPAFASGYGPAPYYNPTVGAPTSQQGQNTQTIAADEAQTKAASNSYGGVASVSTQSGARPQETGPQSIYFGH
jgi:hypothetical protein